MTDQQQRPAAPSQWGGRGVCGVQVGPADGPVPTDRYVFIKEKTLSATQRDLAIYPGPSVPPPVLERKPPASSSFDLFIVSAFDCRPAQTSLTSFLSFNRVIIYSSGFFRPLFSFLSWWFSDFKYCCRGGLFT